MVLRQQHKNSRPSIRLMFSYRRGGYTIISHLQRYRMRIMISIMMRHPTQASTKKTMACLPPEMMRLRYSKTKNNDESNIS